jgi:hypothetical protein
MAKVHELLAVQGNLNGQATKTRTGLIETLQKKRHLFEKKLKTFTPKTEEGGAATVEEQQDIQTTVVAEIEWLQKHLVKMLNVGYQVDLANREAKADIVTEDGQTLARDVPATTLLWLEKRVTEIKELIDAIPSLDPAKGFQPDHDAGKGIYKAREVTKTRSRKMKKVYVKFPATKEHPAQTELVDEDVPVGTTAEQEWSALITPALKADLLNNADMLYRAVTKARSKANEHEITVEGKEIGAELLDYVFKPLIAS